MTKQLSTTLRNFISLDSGASNSVLNYPVWIRFVRLLNITCNNTTQNSSKTIIVANQTEDPVLHYVTLTLNTTI